MNELRILILAPTGRDAALTCALLSKANLQCHVCASIDDVAQEIASGAGAAVVAEEALTARGMDAISKWLDKQPPWADFPFVVIAAGGQSSELSAKRFMTLKPLGNFNLLERPFHLETMLAVVQSVLRARRRQYEVRDYLQERERFSQELERKVEERTHDLTQSQQALSQSRRLEAIGRLAGGVAHDFNNLMTGIMGIAHEILEDMRPEHPHHEDVRQIVAAAQRAAQLTRQLLAFGRKQVSSPSLLDLNGILREMLRMFRRLLRENIELDVKFVEPLKSVRIDPGQFEQVMLNLILNARDAMPEGGRIQIRTANIAATDPLPGFQDRQPGPYVHVRVADSGGGMSGQVLERLFEPFFTTKELGKGSGMGLATAYGIIKQHGGDILASSEMGKGSVFNVYLPAVDEPVKSDDSAAIGGATIV
jgi:signal transduction histidine kinase